MRCEPLSPAGCGRGASCPDHSTGLIPIRVPDILNPMKTRQPSWMDLRSLKAVMALTGSMALMLNLSGAGPAMAQPPGRPAEPRPVYQQWTTYFNPRFAYEVPVPPGMRAQSDPRQGSSCRFVSADGLTVLKAWGQANSARGGDPMDEAWREALNLPGRRIEFRRRTPQAFVLAGTMADGSGFFEKVMPGRAATAGFTISYPRSLIRRMTNVVHEIELGFRWQLQGGPPGSRNLPPGGDLPGGRGPWSDGESPDGSPTGGPWPPLVDPTSPPPSDVPGPAPDLSLENNQPPEPPATPPVKPAPPPKREDLPFGIVIPGKNGYVYSPFTDSKKEVDVTGIPTGTKVKCPYTGKVFRVP